MVPQLRHLSRIRPSTLLATVLTLLLCAQVGATPATSTEQRTARVFAHGSRTRHVVALTFDDCRDRKAVLALYRTLEDEHVPATFFPYGYAVRRSPGLWRMVAAAGFPIGNHTLSHPDLVRLRQGGVRYQFRAWRQVVDRIVGGGTIPYARPPFGHYNARTLRAADLEGYGTLVMWDVDTRDWSGLPAAQVAARAERGSNGSIVLMHCGPSATVKALPSIIAAYRARGFGFVTIPELLEGTGPIGGHGRTADQLPAPIARGRPIPS